MRTLLMLAIVVVSGTLALAAPIRTDYGPGFRWSRVDDYQAGTVEGSAAGAPSPDAAGSPAWHYEYASGEGLDSANPWYVQGPTAMVWDGAWLGNPANGLWTASDDNLPAIDRGLLYQSSTNQWIGDWRNSPVVRWTNPTGAAVTVAVEGGLTVGWSVRGDMPYDVEVVVARGGAQGTDRLFEQTLSRPTDSTTQVIPLADIIAEIEAGGSIILSMRAVDAIERPSFVYLNDTAMAIVQISQMPEQPAFDPTGDGGAVLVPEPATIVMMVLAFPGIGGYLRLCRKQRRRT